jgi:hypothetical protein
MVLLFNKVRTLEVEFLLLVGLVFFMAVGILLPALSVRHVFPHQRQASNCQQV